MNDISSVDGVYPLPAVTAQRRAVAETTADNGHLAPHDEVEISDLAILLSQVRDLPDLRLERIAQLQAEIADGTFETPERLTGTVDRLFEELVG